MDVREKLVEQLRWWSVECDRTNFGCQARKLFVEAADYIAHGVTVQEWISVKDRLPEKDGHYLCNYHFGEYPKMTFTQVLDYYATDIVPHFQHTLGDGSMKVTHWMEIPKLPQPPKGE